MRHEDGWVDSLIRHGSGGVRRIELRLVVANTELSLGAIGETGVFLGMTRYFPLSRLRK
jgi:hypothetical protein